MSCPFDEDLMDLAAGELEAARAAELRGHLEGCPTCRLRFEGEEGLVARLAGAPAPQPPPLLRARILAALETEIDAARPWYVRVGRGLASVRGLALAGAAALVALLAWGTGARGPAGPVGITVLAASGTAELAMGAALAEGRSVALAAGARVELDWRGQGRVTVEGPAEWSVDASGVRLADGLVRCAVKPGPEGFRVAGPGIEARVVGTMFSVQLRRLRPRVRDAVVEVLEGRVLVLPEGAGPVLMVPGPARVFPLPPLPGEAGLPPPVPGDLPPPPVHPLPGSATTPEPSEVPVPQPEPSRAAASADPGPAPATLPGEGGTAGDAAAESDATVRDGF